MAEKDQHTQTILNVQSTDSELEQQVTSLKRVNLELEKTIHSLEKLKRKPECSGSTSENTNQTLHLNDNYLSNTKPI